MMLSSCSSRELGHESLHNPSQHSIFSPCKLHPLHSPSFNLHFTKQTGVFLGFNLRCQSRTTVPPTKTPKKRYGGSLPSILRALRSVDDDDVEKTLNPWIGKLNPKEETLILKEQIDWSRVLRIFRWIRSQIDYTPNVIHYNVVLRSLGRAQKWDELRLCWIEMAKDGVFPTNNTYGTLIDVYGKAGLVKEALLWLKHMKIRGIFPDEVTMNTVVRVLKDSGEFDRAERVFKDWCVGRVELDDLDLDSGPISPRHFLLTELFKSGGRIPLSKNVPMADDGEAISRKPRLAATYNTLIDLYAKAGRLDDASRAFGEMLRSGVAPDTVTFNTMIFICGSNGQLAEAELLLSKMDERGAGPDAKTFNTFISLYADLGNMDAVFTYYRKIREVGLSPDTVTYRTMIKILCKRKMVQEVENLIEDMEGSGVSVDEQSLPVVTKMYVDEGLVDRATFFLQKYCSGACISSNTYAAIIDAYAEKGLWAEAEAVFFGKRGLGHKDTVEYNVMIKAYGKAKLYDKAISLFESMRSSGAWPDECTYNSFIQMLLAGELQEFAVVQMGKMKEAGFRPRCATFSALISSYVRMGQISEAVDVYQEMVKAGVEPNEVVYGSLINAFAENGNVKEALQYYQTMEESGVKANQIVLTSLIKAYSKVGCWKEAQDLYGKMKNLEDGPDTFASNSMINLYADLGMVSEAKLIFDSLTEMGRADGVSFAAMMYLYKNMGMLDEAIDVAQEMNQSGLLTDCASFNNVMATYATNGQLRECGELLHQMLTRRLFPDFETFKVMFMVLKKGGLPIEAITQLESSYENGKPYARQAIITSVFSVVGLHALALESCQNFMKAEVGLDSLAYNVAIYIYGASGEVDKALNTLMKMQDMGMKPDLVTYINMVGCYGKAGLLEGVKRIYNQLKYGDIELNESLFRAVIDAYENAGRHDLGEVVNQEMRFSLDIQEPLESDIEEE